MEECQDCPHETSVQRVQLPDGREVRALACDECPWRVANREAEPFSLEAFLAGIAPAGPPPELPPPGEEPNELFALEAFLGGIGPGGYFEEDEDFEELAEPTPRGPFPSAGDRETALWRAACLAPFGVLLGLLRVDGWVVLTGLILYGALGALSGLLGPGCERERSWRTLAWTAGALCLAGVLASALGLGVLQARGMSWPAWTELGGRLAGMPALRLLVWSVAGGTVIGAGFLGGELALRRPGKDSDFREQLTVIGLAGISWAVCTLLTLNLNQGARCGVAAWGAAWVSSQWWPKLCRKVQALARWVRPQTSEVWWTEEPDSDDASDDTMDELLTPSEVAARLGARSLVVGLVWLCLVLALERGTARAISQGSSLALLIGICSVTELWCAGRVTRVWQLALLTAVVTWLAIGGALLNSHYLFGTWSGGLLAGVDELSTALEPDAWGRALLPATLIWGPLWFVATARASGGMHYGEMVAILLTHVIAFVAVLAAVRGQGYLQGLFVLGICDVLVSGLLIWIYEFADRIAIHARRLWRDSLDPAD